jgi:hypothetical protein
LAKNKFENHWSVKCIVLIFGNIPHVVSFAVAINLKSELNPNKVARDYLNDIEIKLYHKSSEKSELVDREIVLMPTLNESSTDIRS